ncbi:hypothetical protein KNN17_21020, partial [Arthrobacter bambusae]|uniref:hypothetical protein n=1 Tax=Arthrobacter bambusae TaxID=1338426 RepID=UPI001F511249
KETPAMRIERYLGELDPTVLPDEYMLQLSKTVSQVTTERGHFLADRLQIAIGQANHAASTRRVNEAKINELAARIAALSGTYPELQRKIDLAREAGIQGRTLDLAQITVDLERAEIAAEAEVERAWVAKVVEHGLEELGYTVFTGFDTISPGAEGLVRRTIWNHHALSVGISAGEVSLEIVRTADEELSHLSAVRDKEVETSWCKDFPRLLNHLQLQGIVAGRVRRVAPGLAPARRLDSGKFSHRGPRPAVQREQGMK